jgi:LysR family transcriptional regulator, transcriptional activator of the cysJI operon
MNLNQLKIFYMAAKRGNLSRAAGDLFITQPAVTKGIQRIQAHYDIRLMDRFGKKMVLTHAGEVLYNIAEKIFELEKHAEESIREFKQGKTGRIRIQASESFGAYYLPSIMNPFCKANPLINISVTILPTEHVVKNIADLACDIGFISHPFEHEKVRIIEILEDQLVFILPPEHPICRRKRLKPKDLQGNPIIVHEKESTPHQVLYEFIKKNNIAVSSSLELSSNRAIKQAVESGLGIALISRKVADEEIQTGRLKAIPVPDQSIKRKFYLVHHKEKFISDMLQGFIDQVSQWADEYAKQIP